MGERGGEKRGYIDPKRPMKELNVIRVNKLISHELSIMIPEELLS